MTDDGPVRLIRSKEVLSLTSLSKTTIWAMIRSNQFPQPLILNPHRISPRIAWRLDEIEQWIASRPRGSGRGAGAETYRKMGERADERRRKSIATIEIPAQADERKSGSDPEFPVKLVRPILLRRMKS
jgi:prophage regulatory protein